MREAKNNNNNPTHPKQKQTYRFHLGENELNSKTNKQNKILNIVEMNKSCICILHRKQNKPTKKIKEIKMRQHTGGNTKKKRNIETTTENDGIKFSNKENEQKKMKMKIKLKKMNKKKEESNGHEWDDASENACKIRTKADDKQRNSSSLNADDDDGEENGVENNERMEKRNECRSNQMIDRLIVLVTVSYYFAMQKCKMRKKVNK